ncbi:MAG TPA: LacI family DNA-binding transcriptional regulator [Flavitalea sp.]|nr:LacI family DNA-binding transcriptional regulator [Flavitalea sp.]
MKKVSLKDIAREVGVSIALVSYVLNNKREGRISKQIAARIKEVARKLNYRTNQIARSLKISKTFTLGLIVADISNPFSSALARIVEDEADHHGYTVLFGSSDENATKFKKLIDTFLNRQVDGLIVSPPADSEDQLLMLQQMDLPFVLLDRYFPTIKTNYVAINNYQAAKNAVSHLIEKGSRQVGLLSFNSTLYHLKERKRGYLSALKENGITSKKRWIKEVDIFTNKEETEKAMAELIKGPDPVDAVLFGSNVIAGHALHYINSTAIRVPEELAIVSFDETDALDLFYSPLSYIRQPLTEMGRQATRILLDCVEHNNKVSHIEMETTLVVRASSVRRTE